MERYPSWLKQRFSPDGTRRQVGELLSDLGLATVCESALCPNLSECWSLRQLTFMILGERCTRSCRFCAVSHIGPMTVDADEPRRVAEAVHRLGLRHVVITSVARDDLRDEGAGHFVDVIAAVRQCNPQATVEVLVPDFHGRAELVDVVVTRGRPEVFAHNLETVERLSPVLRPQASYRRSLDVLACAAHHSAGRCVIKSGLMVGVGETEAEVTQALQDLREVGVTHVTIGQYLRPTASHLPVAEYVSPDRFEQYRRLAQELGFAWVMAGPFVRSSYHAIDAITTLGADDVTTDSCLVH